MSIFQIKQNSKYPQGIYSRYKYKLNFYGHCLQLPDDCVEVSFVIRNDVETGVLLADVVPLDINAYLCTPRFRDFLSEYVPGKFQVFDTRVIAIRDSFELYPNAQRREKGYFEFDYALAELPYQIVFFSNFVDAFDRSKSIYTRKNFMGKDQIDKIHEIYFKEELLSEVDVFLLNDTPGFETRTLVTGSFVSHFRAQGFTGVDFSDDLLPKSIRVYEDERAQP